MLHFRSTARARHTIHNYMSTVIKEAEKQLYVKGEYVGHTRANEETQGQKTTQLSCFRHLGKGHI